MRHIAAFIAAALAAGCAQIRPPTDAEAAAADYGPPMSQAEAERAVRTYLAGYLRDPGSAQLSAWSAPTTYWFGTRDTSTYGYLVCVNLNAKNAFGAYVGAQRDGFLLRSGAVVRHFPRGIVSASQRAC